MRRKGSGLGVRSSGYLQYLLENASVAEGARSMILGMTDRDKVTMVFEKL